MAQLADAVERAPRADGVLGTRESERGVQRPAPRAQDLFFDDDLDEDNF